MGAAFLAALLLSAAAARANDLGQPQNPVVTHPHGVPTTTTYSWGNGGRAVVIGRPVNVQHGPSAAQLRTRTWQYFINPPPPPPPRDHVAQQGLGFWLRYSGGYGEDW